MNQEQKTVLITGGAQGIGKGMAIYFLKQNFSVVIADYDEEAGNETCEELRSLGQIIFIPTDVSLKKQIINCVDKTVSTFGKIDVLINNAAKTEGLYKKITDLTLEEWNKTLETNLTSVFLFTKYCIPHLEKTKGCIINIASTRALMSEADTESYSATKGGIVSLTHSLAVSLSPEIKVNCISPGWIDTTGFQKSSAKKKVILKPEDHSQHPSGRIGKVEDVAQLAFFLSQPENSFITGQNIILDGGMTKKMIYV